MTKRSYKELEKQRREEEILDSAERLLLERGYTNLNMDELAEAVGISKPTLYQHFKSKDDLLARVIQQAFDIVHQRLEMSAPCPAIERLELVMRSLLESHHAPDSVLAGLSPELVAMA